MTLNEHIKELEDILKVHPEAGEAHIWASGNGYTFRVEFIRFDKRHKPSRIVLDED